MSSTEAHLHPGTDDGACTYCRLRAVLNEAGERGEEPIKLLMYAASLAGEMAAAWPLSNEQARAARFAMQWIEARRTEVTEQRSATDQAYAKIRAAGFIAPGGNG